MNNRFNYAAHASELNKKMFDLTVTSKKTTLDYGLHHLVHILASQINGCAFCVDMHTKEAKIHGERELRLYHLPIWRESSLFTDREKAAFEWTEILTKLPQNHIHDEDFQNVSKHFSEKEVSELTFTIAIINSWNRLAKSSAAIPGSMDEMLGLGKANLS